MSAANHATFRVEAWQAALRLGVRKCVEPGGQIRKRPTYRTVARRNFFQVALGISSRQEVSESNRLG